MKTIFQNGVNHVIQFSLNNFNKLNGSYQVTRTSFIALADIISNPLPSL